MTNLYINLPCDLLWVIPGLDVSSWKNITPKIAIFKDLQDSHIENAVLISNDAEKLQYKGFR